MITEDEYRPSCTPQTARTLEALTRQLARQFSAAPPNVEIPGPGGWLIAERIAAMGNEGTEWYKSTDLLVLGRDGYLYEGRRTQVELDGRPMQDDRTFRTMSARDYETWDAKFIDSYRHTDADHHGRLATRVPEYWHSYTGGIRSALVHFENHGPLPFERSTVEMRSAAMRADRDRDRLKSIGVGVFFLLIVAVPVWILTPVVAFVIAKVSDNADIYKTFAWNGEHHEGDLYPLLAILLPTMILCIGALGLVFPYEDDETLVSIPAIIGFTLGLVLLGYQAVSGNGGAHSWFWPPLFAVLAHLVLGIYRALRNW
ncbi:hypothetical protein [Nocardia brasiliensis]|uniref:hypothetical protein n=1 Tax=Nocardia brasiliensis TaxID=37326 RepID=UPI002456B6E8|nr:hypothetical protein [Nocardia brasiliensis]